MSGSRAERLARLRERLRERGADGFFLPRTDEHGSEYLPPSAERVPGSPALPAPPPRRRAGRAGGRLLRRPLHRPARPGGRRHLFERRHVVTDPPPQVARGQPARGRPARLRPVPGQARRAGAPREGGGGPGRQPRRARPRPGGRGLARPAGAPLGPGRAAGRPLRRRAQRRQAGADRRPGRGQGADWLLADRRQLDRLAAQRPRQRHPLQPPVPQLRAPRGGRDLPLVRRPAQAPGRSSTLGNGVAPEPIDGFLDALDQLGRKRGARFGSTRRRPISATSSGCRRPGPGWSRPTTRSSSPSRARTRSRSQGAVDAQRRDGAAVARFLAWLSRQPPTAASTRWGRPSACWPSGRRTRCSAARASPPSRRTGRTPPLPHYRSTPESNRPLTGGTVYLVDSGGQYLDATTDITRTVALGEPTAEMRERFTLVLKGHIAIATAVFPEGTGGAQLDTLARMRALARRARLRPRHRPRRRRLSVRPRGAAADQQAGRERGAQARHDRQQRARLLQAGRLRDPDREPRHRREAAEAGGRRARAAGLRHAHALPDRPAADRGRPPHA